MGYDAYLSKIQKTIRTGKATEHSHRPTLKDLVESIADGIIATNEPKREECGAPDYIFGHDEKVFEISI